MSDNVDSEIPQQAEKTIKEMGYSPSDPSESKLKEFAENMMSFTDVKHAIAGTLKLMDGAFGGGFYIRYLQDSGTKRGWLELTILFPDETFKKLIIFKNSLRQTDTESSGVYFRPKKNSNGEISRSYDFMLPVDADFLWLHQYERPDMPIPAKVLATLIRENYPRIPISELHQNSSLEEIYLELYQRALEYSETFSFGFMNKEDRFFVSSGDFNEVVRFHGWSPNEAKTALNAMGLLIKDKNPNSYQFSKRVRGEMLRFYVLRKTLKQNLPEPISLEDTTYQHVPQSKQEAEIKRLQGFVADLENELFAIRSVGKEPDPGVAL